MNDREQIRKMDKNYLKGYTTQELVNELKERESVKTITAEPYQDVTVTENGPAIILVVTD